MAHALALHSWRVTPTEAGTPVFWKGTAVTRRLRSSALSRRTDRVQNPQAPSNTRVRYCGRSVEVTNLIVPLPSGGGAKGQTGWRNFAELTFHARQGEAPGLLDADPLLDLGRLGSVPRNRRVH